MIPTKVIITGAGDNLVAATVTIAGKKVECEIATPKKEKQFTDVKPFILRAPEMSDILIERPPTKRELYGNHKQPYKYHK